MLNNLKIRIFISFILSITSQLAFGQFFSTDQNPLSVNWRVIEVNGFRIIYPAELEADAQRMANTIPAVYPLVGASLGRQKTVTSLILQNRGSIANGFVQLAPKKVEFYTTPPQNFDSQDWLNNLAVHELRHVAQFDKLTGGKAHPFPEEIYFAYMGAAVPTWFFEGDAVGIETALTNAGRGRQPSWIMPYRSQLLSAKSVSYSKAYFGSQNDPTIGYYQLGYLITSNIRKQFGREIFDSVLTDIARRPIRLYPFSASLKKLTGKNTRQWFHQTQIEIANKWAEQDHKNQPKVYPLLNCVTDFETNYYLPVQFDDHLILSLKQSKTEAAHFVFTDRGKKTDRTLIKIGYQEQPWFSYANGKIVWDEIRTDPRYAQRSYSIICSYDIRSKKLKQLSHRSKLFSPTLSPDGKKIAAIAVDLSNHFSLVELNASTGAILKIYPNPQRLILQTPGYDQNGTSIAYITVSEKGKSLNVLKTSSGITETLITNSPQQISRPVFINNKIAFNAHFSGIDNIYCIDTTTRKIMALTASKFGAFNPGLSAGNQILFNDYNETGYCIAETDIRPIEQGANNFVNFGTSTIEQEQQGNVFEAISEQTFVSKKYPALSGFFNFHSLSPDVDENDNPGLLLKSNNLLNTVNIFAGAHAVTDLWRLEYNAGIDFKALYPIFSINYSNRPRQAYYNGLQGLKLAEWRENYVKIQASVPLAFSSLNDYFNLNLRVATSYTQRYTQQNIPLIKELRFPFEYGISFSHSTRTAERDVAPAWGQYFAFNAYQLPAQNQLTGALYAFASNFYFPGILKNHSFSAGFSYQKANGAYLFNNEIPEVYGYNQINALNPLKNTLLLNYRFPFAFPDKELGAIAYVRDLRGGIFVDYENLGTDSNLQQPKTFGFELRSSMNLFRYLPIADIGGRLIFVNKKYNQDPVAELILNFNL